MANAVTWNKTDLAFYSKLKCMDREVEYLLNLNYLSSQKSLLPVPNWSQYFKVWLYNVVPFNTKPLDRISKKLILQK